MTNNLKVDKCVKIYKNKNMNNILFPIHKTKIQGLKQKFNLSDPEQRKLYFEAKAGKEIEKLKKYFQKNTFISYLLGKKNSGKGTYSKMFSQIVSEDKIDHLSVGDMIRNLDNELSDDNLRNKLIEFLTKNYRGTIVLNDIISSLVNRSTSRLLPTELILTLLKRETEKRKNKTLFIDGFPRGLDQISFSLFFRDLIGFRTDADIFILINVPNQVINERIKFRRICPKCQLSLNLNYCRVNKLVLMNKSKNFI